MIETINSRILDAVRKIEKNDAKLASELNKVRQDEKYILEANYIKPKLEGLGSELESMDTGPGMALETIVLRVGRPVLTVANGEAILEFRDAESQVWKERLENARERLLAPTASVGRIELLNHFQFDWVGTGWLVSEELLVTNRHVAEIFAQSNDARFIYRTGRDSKPLRAQIDFLEEANSPEDFTFELSDVLHIEREKGPDMALIKVKRITGKKLPTPIALSSSAAQEQQDVAVIGYPARDSRIPDQQLMLDIFGDVFDKKRLAPGQVISSSDKVLLHDCSTLGGNSGSAIIDLRTGEAVGLHFAGRFLESNFAVPAAVIKNRIKKLGGAGAVSAAVAQSTEAGSNGNGNGHGKVSVTAQPVGVKTQATPVQKESGKAITFTIPIQVSISVGDIVSSPTLAGNGAGMAAATIAASPKAPVIAEEDETFFTEARIEDYSDREGYDPDFIDVSIPLPQLKSSKNKDIQKTLDTNDTELRYTHFSVVMSKSRRQCFFSACNIDGKQSKKADRGPWRLDPRIPENMQIMKECYGNPPKFSRGHMTRREDPIWGPAAEARKGNDDSMHVTNAVPQMQSMNAGIWLALENYALQNARKDDMRISVFTGPIFKPGDPVKFGVKIPVSFWKVIAFIHDDTGELSATGYTLSQRDFLEEEEFVFGKFKTAQVPISWIENQAGLSFGELADLDPLNTETESIADTTINTLEQIRFY